MKHLVPFILFIVFNYTSFSQSEKNDYLAWSSTRKLTVNDFGIKIKDTQTNASYAQFIMGYQVNGFDMFAKNFNRKVQNNMIPSASWIGPAMDVAVTLQYQQTLFDIAEVYARQFRKQLKINKRKFVKGTSFVKDLDASIMAAFTKRRLLYDLETTSGFDKIKQQQWEDQVQKELDELKMYSRE